MIEFLIKLKICERVPHYQTTRWWQGFMYLDYMRNCYVTCIMPFNLIGAFLRTIYLTIKRANSDAQRFYVSQLTETKQNDRRR